MGETGDQTRRKLTWSDANRSEDDGELFHGE